MEIFEGNIADVVSRKIFPGKVCVENGVITKIEKTQTAAQKYILPGLVDSHVHIESSMLTPQFYGEAALCRGVVAAVADPHEITNVCGENGFNFMLKDAALSPMKIFFGVPSCVPATGFETSGAVLDSAAVKKLLKNPRAVCLAEMMNFPGVLNGDGEVFAKIAAAKNSGKPVDGHAPSLSGENLKKYAAAGISTDHECTSLEEALEKIRLGMKIQLREGSAAKNLSALAPLFKTAPESLMLCTDDCHPDDLIKGYLFDRIKTLLKAGYDFFDVLCAATLNPVKHYKLNVGLLQEGGPADFVIVDNVEKFNILQVVVDGKTVVRNKKFLFEAHGAKPVNNFNCKKISASDIAVKADSPRVRTIKVIDKELFTESVFMNAVLEGGFLKPNVKNDVLKIVCLNRYVVNSKPAVGFIHGFSLKFGALASCVAHDSHNIICVGTDDAVIAGCVNKIISNKGGLAVSTGQNIFDMPLDIGGIMTAEPCEKAAGKYSSLSRLASALGCRLTAPFMTLAFMALPVIPKLKITDKGLFDVEKMLFVS
jgi:adenine deaminase